MAQLGASSNELVLSPEEDSVLEEVQNLAISDTGEKYSTDELKAKLKIFFRPVKEKLRAARKLNPDHEFFPMPIKLGKALLHLIWDMDMFFASEGVLRRALINVHNDFFNLGNEQTDYEDMLTYKPVEIIAAKCTQVFISMAIGDWHKAERELQALTEMNSHAKIIRDDELHIGVLFLEKTLGLCLKSLGDVEDICEENIPSFNDMPSSSRCVVWVARVYFSQTFRTHTVEREHILRKIIKADPTNVEWCYALSNQFGRRRRAFEKKHVVETAISINPFSPFTRLYVIDFILDSIKNYSKVNFYGFKLVLRSQEEIIAYLREEATKLVTEFPRNVHLLSVLSDTFLRYVPYIHFDLEFGGALLKDAYELNPRNPKTLHRLGIYWRMSLKNIKHSLKYFQDAVRLDPWYFNANMEVFKTLIGSSGVGINVPKLMEETLENPFRFGWSEMELAEYYFLWGLAHFGRGERESTLKIWKSVVNWNEAVFKLTELDRTASFYAWNTTEISSEILRDWIRELHEKTNVKSFTAVTVNKPALTSSVVSLPAPSIVTFDSHDIHFIQRLYEIACAIHKVQFVKNTIDIPGVPTPVFGHRLQGLLVEKFLEDLED